MEDVPSCPFCEFTDSDTYFLTQHVELCHPENGESPFIAKDFGDGSNDHLDQEATSGSGTNTPSQDATDSSYVQCPHGCGESVTAAELPVHIDFHVAEGMALEETGLSTQDAAPTDDLNESDEVENIEGCFSTDLPRSLRNRDQIGLSSSSQGKRSARSLMDFLLGAPNLLQAKKKMSSTSSNDGWTRRLGVGATFISFLLDVNKIFQKAELGPHAHEKQMPSSLRRMLEEGPKVTVHNEIGPDGSLLRVESVANETPHLVPVLAQLCDQDPSVEHAFFCHPAVRHIVKMPREGGFCGYRNIQMMISYIQDAQAQGHQFFVGRTPSILKLQDIIEDAWEKGFNSSGKVETGGIKGTRKYIGTPEVR